MTRDDWAGRTVGRLTVVGKSERRVCGTTAWLCRCECGGEAYARLVDLRRGRPKSCGCVNRSRTHGASRTPEFRVWCGLRQRCNSSRYREFYLYGGRGIRVCERWLGKDRFANFLQDMGRRPSARHSIERKDVNGDYAPENCVWATATEQARNKRNNRLLTFNGKTQPLPLWADEVGVSVDLLHSRLYRKWSVRRALTTPADAALRKISFGGESLTLTHWARRLGISPSTLHHRLATGWPLAKALAPKAGTSLAVFDAPGVESEGEG